MITALDFKSIGGCSWHPDGKSFAVLQQGKGVFHVDAVSGKIRGQFRVPPCLGLSPFNLSGTHMAIAVEQGKVVVWDVAQGELCEFAPPHVSCSSANIDPSGRYIVISTSRDKGKTIDVLVYALHNTQLLNHITINTRAFWDAYFSPCGTQVVMGGTAGFWCWHWLSGELAFFPTARECNYMSYHPQSHTLLYSLHVDGYGVYVLDFKTPHPSPYLLIESPEQVEEMERTEHQLFLHHTDCISVWNIHTREEIYRLPCKACVGLSVSQHDNPMMLVEQVGKNLSLHMDFLNPSQVTP